MLAKNSSRSPFRNKTSQQLHCEISKGAPYTQLPVPVSISSKRFSTENEFPQNSNNSNKIYKVNSNNRNVQMVRSADCKIRKNPGLMNIGRKVNLNEYGEDNLYCEAQAIRKFGMQYRRKLMERYHNESNAKFNMYNKIQPKREMVINHQKQIVNWYESRNEGLNSMMSDLLIKMQRQLGAKQYGKEERQVLLSQLNRQLNINLEIGNKKQGNQKNVSIFDEVWRKKYGKILLNNKLVCFLKQSYLKKIKPFY